MSQTQAQPPSDVAQSHESQIHDQAPEFTRDFRVDLIRRQADQGYWFVDCLSFFLMKERKIAVALTTDAHFRKAVTAVLV